MTFYLEIVTPEKKIFQGEINKLTVPSINGQLTILAHHTALFTPLAEGKVKIVDQNNKINEYPIGKGMVEVKKNKVLLLLEPLEHGERMASQQANEAETRVKMIDKSKLKPTGEIPISEAFRRSILDLRNIKIKRKTRNFPA